MTSPVFVCFIARITEMALQIRGCWLFRIPMHSEFSELQGPTTQELVLRSKIANYTNHNELPCVTGAHTTRNQMVRSFIMVATLIQLARHARFPRKVSRPPSAALFDNSPARRRRFRLHRSWSGVPISPRAIELAQPGDTICLEGILECGAVVTAPV